MAEIDVQLVRLRRHYDHAVATFDDAALLDLSHSLRVWVELKESLTKQYPAFESTKRFRGASVPRKVVNASRAFPFVFVYLGGPVVTRAGHGELVGGRDNGGAFVTAFSVRSTVEGIEFGYYAYVEGTIEASARKAMEHGDTFRGNYSQWLGQEAAKVCRREKDGKLSILSLPRQALIKRVANTMGGSHPGGSNDSDGDQGNLYDPWIATLMERRVGGLPLPYFILLKCAQDILDIAPDLLKK